MKFFFAFAAGIIIGFSTGRLVHVPAVPTTNVLPDWQVQMRYVSAISMSAALHIQQEINGGLELDGQTAWGTIHDEINSNMVVAGLPAIKF
jgi:hypothetical protein